MLNRVVSAVDATSGRSPSAQNTWRTDDNPNLRLIGLLLVMALPLVAVAGRVAYLQAFVVDDYASWFGRLTESFESIPARDGRILSPDGRVLAHDVEQMDVHVHYRWLEEPPDESWLRYQALSRLDRRERNDREAVEREKEAVLALREDLWTRLSALAGLSRQQLNAQREDIQHRVERIIASVERRQRERREEAEAVHAPPAGETGWWTRIERAFLAAVAAPPRRDDVPPIIVAEELDYHLLIEDVDLEVAVEIGAQPERYPGLQVKTSTQRVYPEGTLAPHIVGSRLSVTDEIRDQRKQRFPHGDPLDYRLGDRIGRTGVEKSYDSRLRGLRGQFKVVKNRQGEVVAKEVVREPRHGGDVVLTLHGPLQQRAEQLLDETLTGVQGPISEGAAIVLLDAYTGAVLVAASAPRYDLNLLIHPDKRRWRQAMEDPRRPFFHRVTDMTLPPGSVFKTLTSVALLESRRIDPDERMFCRGYLDRPDRFRCYVYRHYGHGHGDVNLSDALCQSCNVYFYDAARHMGDDPVDSARHLSGWARRFGFGSPSGIDLPGEKGGNLPTPDEPGRAWFPGETLGMAIGQARLTVTPLQIARLMAAVANGGYLVTPHVVAGGGPAVVGNDELDLSSRRRPQPIHGLTEGTLERVREGLRRVVEDQHGTGYKTVRLKSVSIAGKTGTAEVGAGGGDHAWFAGYVPADEPRYAFVVVLEHAGSGGRAAGPVAQQLVQSMLDLGLLRPSKLTLRESAAQDGPG